MITEMNLHAKKVDDLTKNHDPNEVERMVEICMTLDNLIDPMSVFLSPDFETMEKRIREDDMPRERPRLHHTGDKYLDGILNTKEYRLKEMKRIHNENKDTHGNNYAPQRLPFAPITDSLLFFVWAPSKTSSMKFRRRSLGYLIPLRS